MTKTILPEKLIDAIYTRLYPKALPGVLTYIQKIETICQHYLAVLMIVEKESENECECGTVGCTGMRDEKCHICQDAFERLCGACQDALTNSDAYLDYQAGQAEEDQMEEPEGFDSEEEWD